MCILLQPCLTRPCEMRFGQWHVHSVSKFPGEPIEIYKVFELLLGSRDQLRRIRHGICDVKDDDAGSAWCRMPGFPSLNTEILMSFFAAESFSAAESFAAAQLPHHALQE